MKIIEGYAPFLTYQTYYRIVGEPSTKAPLLLLHGGPGSTHNYFELFDELAKEGRQIIMYDQLGCGLSSMPDNNELWQAETWLDELVNLRNHLELEELHILGQSWGGMLLIKYLCDLKPEGIKSVILSSTLPSSSLWKTEQHRLIKLMSDEDQEAIAYAEKNLDFSQPAYLAANERFMLRHASDVFDESSKEPLRRKKRRGEVSYLTAWGPNEFSPMGTLKDFDYTNQLGDIKEPTLITSGIDDLSTPIVSKKMHDEISQSEWLLFSKSRHMPFVDEEELYLRELSNWLEKND